MKFPTQASIEAFHREAGGAFETVVIRRRNMLGLTVEARTGSAKALAFLRVLGEWLVAARDMRPLCLKRGCKTEFSRKASPAAFVIVLPYRDDAQKTIVSGVCAQCADARSDDDLLLLLRQIWSDLRIINRPHDGGHA
jgi:hypothetical protein